MVNRQNVVFASGAGILPCTWPDGSSGWVWWVLAIPTVTGIAGWQVSRTSRDMLAGASDTSP